MGGRGRIHAALAALALAGCSLAVSLDGLSGGADDDGGVTSPDGSTIDTTEAGGGADGGGGIDAPDDSLLGDVAVDVVDACSAVGCVALPSGFSLVAYGPRSACPTNFTQTSDTVENASVGSGGCTCGCSVTTNPSCSTGTMVGHFGTAGAGTCPSAGGDLANTSLCASDGFMGAFAVGNEHRYTPPAPSGGACSAAPNKDATKLAIGASKRLCQATVVPSCNGKVCPPSLTGGFAACIAAAGDVSCPSTFPNKHLVGSSASFTCGAGCTCGVTATCSGRLDYYASANCTGMVQMSLQVDDACHPTVSADAGDSFASRLWNPTVSNVGCTNGGSTSASTSLAGETTICCL